MFVNMQKKSSNIFTVLEQSPFTFYLTGSRYFGDAVENSDWDFFVQHDRGVISFLESHGFELVHRRNEKYKDEICLYTYRKLCPELGYGRAACVDIQVVIDAPRKNKAQEYIVQHVLLNVMLKQMKKKWGKGAAEYIWNLVFAVVHNKKSNYDSPEKNTVPCLEKILGPYL